MADSFRIGANFKTATDLHKTIFAHRRLFFSPVNEAFSGGLALAGAAPKAFRSGVKLASSRGGMERQAELRKEGLTGDVLQIQKKLEKFNNF